MSPPQTADEWTPLRTEPGRDHDRLAYRPRLGDGPDASLIEAPAPRPATPLAGKLAGRMTLLGLSQQALAQRSGVSDSEVSRLLKGQSKRPGLHNILRIARALGVSVDFLADDSLAADPLSPPEPAPSEERALLDEARDLGLREVRMLLDATRILGFETAIRRLYGIEPRPSPDATAADPLA